MNNIKPGDLEKVAQKNGYKFVALLNSTGQIIVPSNSPKVKLPVKAEQIRKRYSSLPDGVYLVRFQEYYGKKWPAYDFVLQKGDVVTPEVVNDNKPVQVTLMQAPQENARSFEAALNDKEELARLRAEKESLALRLKSYEEEEDEEEEDGEEGLQEANPWAGFLKEIVPQFMPVIDRAMDQRDRQLNLKEKELSLAEQGIFMPGNNAPQVRRRVAAHPFRPVPSVDAPEFDKYLDWLDSLSDQAFQAEIVYLQKQNAADHLAAINAEFFPDDENNQE